jgi:hypothetical protein
MPRHSNQTSARRNATLAHRRRSALLTLSFATGLSLLSPAGPGARAAPLEPERDEQESFLKRAVFSDRRLWLLSDAGVLFSLAEHDAAPRREPLPEAVYDVCRQNGRLTAVTGPRTDPDHWTIRTRANGAWKISKRIPAEDEGPLALSCAQDHSVLLTSRRVLALTDGSPREVTLKGALRRGLVSVVHATADHVFVGVNGGEWGGGLQRIDRRDGAIVAVEKNPTGDLCGGPLNAACDPVNGIADNPWKPGCIVVTVGLVHFSPTGRLVEVCSDRIERLYEKPYVVPPTPSDPPQDSEPYGTVAFFGLVGHGETLTAAGIDGIYRFGPGGSVDVTPMPEFRMIGPFAVSFALPDVILVLTDISRRASVSGATPILVPR